MRAWSVIFNWKACLYGSPEHASAVQRQWERRMNTRRYDAPRILLNPKITFNIWLGQCRIAQVGWIGDLRNFVILDQRRDSYPTNGLADISEFTVLDPNNGSRMSAWLGHEASHRAFSWWVVSPMLYKKPWSKIVFPESLSDILARRCL